MSGIAAIYNLNGHPLDRALLRRMTDVIAHRGPDGSGLFVDGAVGLSHQMLRTTPESLHEEQPLADETSNLILTLDGRVDNRDELKAALKAFKKRLKLTQLDDQSRIGRGPMSGGHTSGIMAITPPDQFPQAVWDELARQGKLKKAGSGMYELRLP